jgi:small subunit ribosomal protein S5
MNEEIRPEENIETEQASLEEIKPDEKITSEEIEESEPEEKPLGGGRKRKKSSKDSGPRTSRQKRGGDALTEGSEFTEKVVQVRRVTKVVKGGKKLSFRVVVIIGNEKGKVGVGVGKASEVLSSIKKAISDARKNIVEVPMVKSTISHTVTGVASGAEILLKPAADGTGIIAGGAARIVLELSGVGDILSKSKGSKSPLNVARATVNGLMSLRNFQEVASSRGMSLKQMLY